MFQHVKQWLIESAIYIFCLLFLLTSFNYLWNSFIPLTFEAPLQLFISPFILLIAYYLTRLLREWIRF
ncbi:hypothetical protein ACI2JA_14195 [Alkalihalobacillus sp. NPDC078783]